MRTSLDKLWSVVVVRRSSVCVAVSAIVSSAVTRTKGGLWCLRTASVHVNAPVASFHVGILEVFRRHLTTLFELVAVRPVSGGSHDGESHFVLIRAALRWCARCQSRAFAVVSRHARGTAGMVDTGSVGLERKASGMADAGYVCSGRIDSLRIGFLERSVRTLGQ
ncbi:hypothetical protein HPB52_009302 [Rhipicephalus sanguineus]|uniref:Uncharacterized protein n=1 Tax=Rhipicephalus sanguineus TaxID=34632 RepID=A0A9D4PD88_RHISA|nr:hypothetical protein HPB52_009302 [Rhipicephalus sanguineus]